MNSWTNTSPRRLSHWNRFLFPRLCKFPPERQCFLPDFHHEIRLLAVAVISLVSSFAFCTSISRCRFRSRSFIAWAALCLKFCAVRPKEAHPFPSYNNCIISIYPFLRLSWSLCSAIALSRHNRRSATVSSVHLILLDVVFRLLGGILCKDVAVAKDY